MALAAASVLFVLGLAELAVRLVWEEPKDARYERRKKDRGELLRPSRDEALVYELVPGAEGDAWGTRVRVNRHGFRGADVALRNDLVTQFAEEHAPGVGQIDLGRCPLELQRDRK